MTELTKIIDILKNDNLSFHHKCFLLNDKKMPDLPPEICECIITLKNDDKVMAYIDMAISKTHWIEYGDSFTIRKNGRRRFEFKEVKEWKLI